MNENVSRRERGGYPRFASFFTIAVAILLLFGAASRLGKVQETAALFGIDTRAENRIRQEEARLRTALTLGAQPTPASTLRPPSGRLSIDQNATPPSRGEFDLGQARGRSPVRPSASIARQTPQENAWNGDADSAGIDTTPFRDEEPRRASNTYVVANGDNWYKIAMRTLGDGKRWKEIQNANPSAREGLRVGMTLVIPN